MTIKLFFEAVLKFALGAVLVGLLIFLPAGTFSYARGWILMGILFVPMFLAGIVMMIWNPSLLKSRLEGKEKEKDQDLVIKLSGLMFLAGFVLSGLGIRFRWFLLPDWVSITASVIFLLSYALYAEVLRENAYLSRTVRVQKGQKVIDRGLYGLVRHPMYSATVLLFLSIPLVLGSLYAFLVFLLYPFLIGIRIRGEERFLRKELLGYEEYTKKVKYRLIPFIW